MEKPQDVVNMEKALKELNDYRNALNAATFPGKEVINAGKLQNFIKDSYDQLLDKLKNHEWVKKAQEEALKKQLEAESVGG
jgi:hypothetical protein